MPKQKLSPEKAVLQAAWDQFETEFKRSKRGNLWRRYQGATLTIFDRDDGSFGWCIADGNTTRYSRGSSESEEDAMSALRHELDIGYF